MVTISISGKQAAGEWLEQGLAHHREGRLEEAASCYRLLLEQEAEHSDALHLLGLIASEQGDHDEAARLIRNAIRVRPGTAVYQANLGLALSRQGNWEEAIDAYSRALALHPDHAATLAKLGRTLAAAGQVEEALVKIGRALELDPLNPDIHNAQGAAQAAGEEFQAAWDSFEKALELDPGFEEAHGNRIKAINLAGEQYFGRQQWEEAERTYRRAVELEPLQARHRYNLAVCVTAQKRIPEAVRCYEQALLLDPANAEAFNNIALLEQAGGDVERALACYQRALELQPDYVEAHYNMGILLGELDDERARQCYEAVLRYEPDHADAHNNLGGLCLAENRLEAALEHYREALRLKPDHADALWNVTMAQLTLGEFESGWAGYEQRLKKTNRPLRKYAQPRWLAEDLKGKTVLVWAEQGLGDTLQFVRYLPLLRERGARVVLECQERLKPLMQCLEGVEQVTVNGEAQPDFDLHTPLLSLPWLFKTRLENIPPTASPWRLPESRLEKWRRRLAEPSGFKVGLCWGGNPENYGGRKRSAPLAALARLRQLEGVRCYSLQRGPHAAELESAGAGIVNLESGDNDILDTAAIIANLDLVISVDTMVAHLAGTLGKPVWTLLPFAADWRWMLDREDTPWYPSMRLFRQARPGDWDELAGRTAAVLERQVRGVEGL